MSTIINLTPHDIVVMIEHSIEDVTFPSSGTVARLSTHEYTFGGGTLEGVEVVRVDYGRLAEEPPKVEDTYYIVSLVTALAMRRPDFLVPYEEIRDDAGRILGCRRFAAIA